MTRLARSLCAGLVAAVAAASAAATADAQQQRRSGTGVPAIDRMKPAADRPVLFTADDLTYDRDLGLIVARGKVEMVQDDRTLLADVVTYNERTNVATASGNVSLLEPTGDVLFADYVELNDNLREGFVRNVRMLLSDGARLAGNDARRTGGNRTQFDNAVYSPCDLCPTDPTRAPLWQVRAAKVVHDQERKVVEYRDATLEMFGVPVVYTPYFSHPDPTVKRKSGFLAPSFGNASDLGVFARVPYYLVISDSQDLTFEPIATSEQGVVLGGEYRQRLSFGYYEIAGSATVADRTTGTTADPIVESNKFRGHIKGRGRFSIDENWRAGFDLARTTDQTYLRRYGYSSEETLTSRAFVEGFYGRSYAFGGAYAFQGLRPEDNDVSEPVIAPVASYQFLSEPNSRGAYWTVDTSLLNLYRQDGTDSRRLSTQVGWQMPFTGGLGDRYTLRAAVRGDGYHVSDFATSPALGDASPTRDGTEGRFYSYLALDWRFPWVRTDPEMQYLIEPLASIVLSPVAGSQGEIPNEDSLDFELNDVNILRANRFPGLDRVDGGQRVTYGINLGAYHQKGWNVRGFLAQSYALQRNRAMPEGSGHDDYRSDFVGRVVLTPADYLDLIYRFRLDKDNFTPRRHELGFLTGPSWLKVYGSYIFLDAPPDEPVTGQREELVLGMSARLSSYWSLFASGTFDFGDGNELLESSTGIKYEDECFAIVGTFRRSRTRDRDIEPKDVFLVRLYFKNLGEFGLPSVQLQ